MCKHKINATMKHVALIVDDSKEITSLVMNMLRMINIDSVFAFDVADAKETINKMPEIDLLVVDYFLPDGTGPDIITYLKKDKGHGDIPVIMVTGGGDSVKLSGLIAGANVVLQKPFSEAEFLVVAKNLVSLADAYSRLADADQIISALINAVEARDLYTKGHSQRVASLAVKLYDCLPGKTKLERTAVYTAGLLHDIGKIGVPDDILNSTERLSDEQFEMIKRHPTIGHEICKKLNRLKPAWRAILEHHEKLDGSGYPQGLSGKKISFAAQIIQIPDMYDAMTTERSYRKAMSAEKAISIIEEEVSQGRVNRILVDTFKYDVLKMTDKKDDKTSK